MGLTMENDLLAITSAQIMALKQNLAQIKDSSSLTFWRISVVWISHVTCQVTIFLNILTNGHLIPNVESKVLFTLYHKSQVIKSKDDYVLLSTSKIKKTDLILRTLLLFHVAPRGGKPGNEDDIHQTSLCFCHNLL